MVKCRQCGNTYDPYWSNYPGFCSEFCYDESHRPKCRFCHKTFNPNMSNYPGFCSEYCYNEYMNRKRRE